MGRASVSEAAWIFGTARQQDEPALRLSHGEEKSLVEAGNTLRSKAISVLYGKFKSLHRNVRKEKEGRAGALSLG